MARGRYMPNARRGALWGFVSKPIALWVVLILAFLAIWQLLNGPSETASHAAKGSQGSVDYSVVAMSLGAFLVAVGWAQWLRRRLRRFNEEAAAALKLFTGADYAAASTRFAELVRKYPRPRYVRATASFNLAMSLLRNGEFDPALETLSAIDPWLPRYAPALRPTVATQLAAVYALRGDPAAADLWIAEAVARAKKVTAARPIDGAVAFVRAVNALRRDEPEEAALVLDAAWTDLEGTLVAVELRPFRALRAFAARSASGARLDPGPAAAAPPDDARPGELAWLGVEWPEMRAFLEGRTRAPGARELH